MTNGCVNSVPACVRPARSVKTLLSLRGLLGAPPHLTSSMLKQNRIVLAIAGAVFLVIVILETVAPANVVGAYGFVLPILLVATLRSRPLMIATVVACVAATYLGLMQPTKPGRFQAAVINRTVVAGVLLMVAYIGMTREERKAREEAARAALAQQTESLLRANTLLVDAKDVLQPPFEFSVRVLRAHRRIFNALGQRDPEAAGRERQRNRADGRQHEERTAHAAAPPPERVMGNRAPPRFAGRPRQRQRRSPVAPWLLPPAAPRHALHRQRSLTRQPTSLALLSHA